MSTSTANSAANAVRLDDLIALHREIAALVRAGIPLELGLRGFSGGLPTRLGRLANRIADRLSEGKSLAEAVDSEASGKSSIYASVIAAGVRSGKLAEALEALASSSEQIQESRRDVSMALIQPTIVSVLAYFLLIGFIWTVVPIYLDSAEAFHIGDDFVFRWLRWVHANAVVWTLVTPLLIGTLVLILFQLFGSQRFWLLPSDNGMTATVLRAIYWILFWRHRLLFGMMDFGLSSNMNYNWLNQAQFAEILRLQIEHGLPMPESFVRAAMSTTDRGLHAAARSVSEDLDRGTMFSAAVSQARGLPPMMRWMLASAERQRTLVETLKLMSDSYRRRAVRRARLLKVWFPVVMTVGVSGTIAFLYGLVFFGTLASFWEGILRE
jgi:general secretion pathway protein F